MKKKQGYGSTLESFLAEEGILEEVRLEALKTSLALQILKAMENQNITQQQMAEKMKTSRAVVQRLLNPRNKSITLQTMHRAAGAVGMHLHIGLRR
jgi:antitoxin HicB